MRPESYPEPTRTVEAIETHMSWVFLIDGFAYKLKKPAKTPFLDFSTLEFRHHWCDEEVRLNQRLAPQVYLGTVQITRADGSLSIGGSGRIVDWLVRMRRLPRDRMLDRAIAVRSFTDEDIAGVAARLAQFYRQAPRLPVSGPYYLLRIAAATATDIEGLRLFHDVLPHDPLDAIGAAQRRFLCEHASMLERRAEDRHIVEAHGDLRPEHVALGPNPQIIDCLEFNPELRKLDPADELAFFALECELLGAPEIGDAVFSAYRAATGDDPLPQLIDFYKCCRAVLRAKLSILHLRDSPVRNHERWPKLANRYLEFALAYAKRLL